ncbi:hypothetical protein [Corynebacterium riegelii]|uniref:hypothetical protein n=1 Tax=Corynebacterium riegelii TaxID=156976 RepID=UPI0023F0AF63|nr:hypothetical protein [Corynebacterium riegelii]
MSNQPRVEEHNARRFIWSNGLQNIGDQIVAPKTVLPGLSDKMCAFLGVSI